MDLNFNNKCRACLAENETMLSIFEIYEHDLTLAMILQSCISSEICENDGMPSHLCDSCILVLTQFYNFTVVYEQSDKQLRSLLKKSKKINRFNEASELETDLNDVISEQGEGLVSEINELLATNSNEQLLHEGAALEVPQENLVTVSCDAQDGLDFYEFKDVDYHIVEEQEINTIAEYEVQEADVIQEFKKEISTDELESISESNNDYLEVHISDSSEALIKQEPKVFFKREIPLYEDIVKYECTKCGEAHLYASSFQQHMRVKHHMFDVKCEDYASRIRIKVQQRIETEKTATPVSQEEDDIFNHNPTQKCKFCDMRFFTKTQLLQHSKLHDAIKKYVCEVCGSRFIRKTYLDDHMEGHSTEKKHVCKFCGKAFRRRTVLRAHKRVHTHPNHYVCELCGRAFTNSSTLKTHRLLIHVKERNFKCVICNLTFPLKSTLNKHVLRHQKRENGEKGFNCTECEMQYRDKSSLKRHIETKHQGRIQLISCPDCPKKYTSKANLMKHRRKHHSAIIEVLSA